MGTQQLSGQRAMKNSDQLRHFIWLDFRDPAIFIISPNETRVL